MATFFLISATVSGVLLGAISWFKHTRQSKDRRRRRLEDARVERDFLRWERERQLNKRA